MAKRRSAERTEAIERIATPRFLLFLSFFLSCLLCLLGSAAVSLQARQPALGSMDSSRPELAEDSTPPEEDRGLYYSVYRVVRGDTLSGIAESQGLSLDTVLSFNDIQNARSLQPGKLLKIPNMSGILYAAKEGDSPASIAAAQGLSADRIVEANGLMSDQIAAGRILFLPDGRLASFKLREISGDLFRWPVKGWITSWYGYRNDPFTGVRAFHNGIDIGVDSGTPVRAAMDGYVSAVGYSAGSGNYILLAHHSGWTSFYGHLEEHAVKVGQRVQTGTRIGSSGNTGYSTGPHLHFSVFKNRRSYNPINYMH